MSGAQHTPGPLYAIHHGTSGHHEVRKDYGDTSHRIATLDLHVEAEADAALFAAAPDMLEALRNMVGLAEEAIAMRKASDDPEDAEMIPVYEQQLADAGAAIAKAGGAPTQPDQPRA